tara:strand:+ start:5264 stop:5554 length:291 start_codon:yes stop_codon:yes gene_type:complete
MGYLNNKDYGKIRKLIETFLDNPMLIDNLFKTIVLFLETKNNIPIIEKEAEFKPLDTEAQRKVAREIINADEASAKFVNKLLKKSDKKGKFSRVTQ